jgi:hypothetical protein
MKHFCRLFMFSLALIVGASSAHAAIVDTTTLNGSNEIPPNASTATGRALVVLGSDNNTLDVNVSFSGLIGGAAVASHIHCCASLGNAAIVAVPFPGFPNATSGTYTHSLDLSLLATYDPGFVAANGGTAASAKAAFVAALRTGKTYINIHNATFPGGEIQGQLAATSTHDFNRDGISDILLQSTDGGIAMWLMNSSAAVGSAVGVGSLSNVWTIIGQRDLNGDGKADILFRNVDGSVAEWLMDSGTITSAIGFGNCTTVWTIVGTGDFNGDGIGDILWRGAGTAVAIWYMNSSGGLASAVGVGSLPVEWVIAGTGDFDGDGIWDILWYHQTSGAIALWLMNSDGTIKSPLGLGSLPVGVWSIAGTGDFNGDGIGDILFSGSSNEVAIWFLNASGGVGSAQGVATMAAGWAIAQTGDFNGDGKADVLLYHSASGSIGAWLMNAASITSAVGVGSLPPSVWTIRSANSE